MTKLKEALEKLLDAAHPAYVSDNHFQKKLIAARDNAFQELESHRLDMKEHIPDDGKMVSLRDYFAGQAMQAIRSGPEWQLLEMKSIAADNDLDLEGVISRFAYKQADEMLKEREI